MWHVLHKYLEEENFQSAEYFVQEAPPGFSVTGFRTFWQSLFEFKIEFLTQGHSDPGGKVHPSCSLSPTARIRLYIFKAVIAVKIPKIEKIKIRSKHQRHHGCQDDRNLTRGNRRLST